MEGSAQTRWESCLQLIRGQISKKEYETWFEPIQIIGYDKQTLTFGLPSKYFYEFLSEHFGGLIYQAVRRVFGEHTQLKYSLTDQTSHVTVNIEPVKWFGLSTSYGISSFGSSWGAIANISLPGIGLFIGTDTIPTKLAKTGGLSVPLNKMNLNLNFGLVFNISKVKHLGDK